ncbi:MAG: transcription antitermination factor NusB [Patescibacteria group bacterium]|jgi:N utilization substance protein B|nr:transcription antitermination factor NusB [Patescibacteria group bacterium]
MASNRHLGRIIAFQTLYEEEFRLEADDQSFDLRQVLDRNVSRYKDEVSDVDFISKLVLGVSKDHLKIDKIIQPIAPEWPINQIARMDRIILRMSIFELRNVPGTPVKVVINEAIELAKEFGAENSSKFINGVLGTYYKNEIAPKESQKEKATKAKKKTPNILKKKDSI